MPRSATSLFDRADVRFVPTGAPVVGLGLAVFDAGCGEGATQGPTAGDSWANTAMAADIGRWR
jgi:hypothetical protein